MKTFILGLIMSACLFSVSVSAQSCAASTGIPAIDPTLNLSEGKFYPLYYSVPCVVVGQPYSQIIQAKNYTYYQGFHVDSVSLDSITNLPCGLCWNSSAPNNMIKGGEQFAIKVSGISNEAYESTFLMHVFIRAWVNGNQFPYSLQSTDSTLFVYNFRTADMLGNCAVPFEGTNAMACSGGGSSSYFTDTCTLPPPIVSVTGLAGDCIDSTAVLSVSNIQNNLVYSWHMTDEYLQPLDSMPGGSTVHISSFGQYILEAGDPSTPYCEFYNVVDITPAGAIYPTGACYEYTDTITNYEHIILAKDPANTHIREYCLFKTNDISTYDFLYNIRYRIDSLVATIPGDSLGEFIDTTGYVLTNPALAGQPTVDYQVYKTLYTLGFKTDCGLIDTFFNGPYATLYPLKPSHLDTVVNSDHKIQLNIHFPGSAIYIGYVQRQVGSGAFQTIDSVYAFSDTSIYVDNTIYGWVSYRIMFMIPPICTPSRSNGLVDVYSNTLTFFSTNGTPGVATGVVPQKKDLAIAYTQDGSHLIATFYLETATNVNAQMQDLSGRTVLSQDWGTLPAGSHTKYIDMSTLASSSYIICVSSDRDRSCRKIAKF